MLSTPILHSPLEQFEVYYLAKFHAPILSSWWFSLTNQGFYCIFITAIILALHISGSTNSVIPTRWSISLEALYSTISQLVIAQVGVAHILFLPFLYSLFIYILTANLISNIPYSFALATSIIFSMGLSFTVFIGVTLIGLYTHKVHWFSSFLPHGTPGVLVPLLVIIETISYLARAFSLGIRLFSNIMAGHILVAILAGFLYKLFFSMGILVSIVTLIPFGIFVGIGALELAVSFIQAFVFTVLTCNYLRSALYLHG